MYMHASIHICIYIYMCVYLYIYIYVCLLVSRTHTHAYTYIYMYVCVCLLVSCYLLYANPKLTSPVDPGATVRSKHSGLPFLQSHPQSYGGAFFFLDLQDPA